jgi:hypothetical protein
MRTIAMRVIGSTSRRPSLGSRGSNRLEATAISRQTRMRAWIAKKAATAAGSRARVRRRMLGVNRRTAAPANTSAAMGAANRIARRRRPVRTCPSPGNTASRKAAT